MLNFDRTNMDRTIDSELTMVTNNAFNNVLQCIQNSCLNYQIQMSPFLAVITLKKPLVKDKFGTPTLPNEEMKNGRDMGPGITTNGASEFNPQP